MELLSIALLKNYNDRTFMTLLVLINAYLRTTEGEKLLQTLELRDFLLPSFLEATIYYRENLAVKGKFKK